MIPLAALIEANECLKLALPNAAAGTYVRLLDAQTALEFFIALALADRKVTVSA